MTRHVVARLVAEFDGRVDRIVVPTFGGKRGHPLLFSASYREEILRCFDDVGLQGLLQAHPQAVCEVRVHTPEVLQNMNLPDDYRQFLDRNRN